MIIDKEEKATILFMENTSIGSFLEKVQEAYPKLKQENLIINLVSMSNLRVADVLRFEGLSDSHRAARKSFVLVTSDVTYEEVPDTLMVVPTLQEARDLIEMEEIERDLEME